MDDPRESMIPGPRSSRLVLGAARILVALLVLLAFAGSSGVGVAQDTGNACPEDNQNPGFEKAQEKGQPNAGKAFTQDPSNVCERLQCGGGVCSTAN